MDKGLSCDVCCDWLGSWLGDVEIVVFDKKCVVKGVEEMKSTKYQLLKDDFEHSVKEIGLLHMRIKELEEENLKLKAEKQVLSNYKYMYEQARY